MFIAAYQQQSTGDRYFLRSTILTGEPNRADKFATVELAKAAIERARKFHKATLIKALEIVPVQS